MRIITEEPLKNFIVKYPDARTALQEWVKNVKEAEWTCFADLKNDYNSQVYRDS